MRLAHACNKLALTASLRARRIRLDENPLPILGDFYIELLPLRSLSFKLVPPLKVGPVAVLNGTYGRETAGTPEAKNSTALQYLLVQACQPLPLVIYNDL